MDSNRKEAKGITLTIQENKQLQPFVNVMVLNYNGKEHLAECLTSLLNLDYQNKSIYIIDNNSTDDSLSYVRTQFPKVIIFAINENLGFAKAYNKAIEAIPSDFVAIVNNDTVLDKNWLKSLMPEFNKDKKLFACEGKILLYSQRTVINHAGGKVGIGGNGWDIGLYEQDHGQYEEPRHVFCTCGAGMVVNRNLWLKLRGFDEDLFAYLEDADVCWRAWLIGLHIKYIPTAKMWHKFGGSWAKKDYGTARQYYNYRNSSVISIKNLSSRQLVVSLLFSLCWNSIKLTKILLLKPEEGLSFLKLIFKSYLYTFKNAKMLWKKRLISQNSRIINDKDLFDKGFIMPPSQFMRESFARVRLKNKQDKVVSKPFYFR